MYRDAKLLVETTSIVKEFACSSLYKLPMSSFQKIAKDLINNGKFGDGSWLARALLKEKHRIERSRRSSSKYGYSPFTNIGFYTYRWIREQYAGWVLPLMATKLDKPEDIYATWGVQFADAMDALGRKACEESNNLYHFVTNSRAWIDAKTARQDYLTDFKRHKKNYKLRKEFNKKTQTNGIANHIVRRSNVFTRKQQSSRSILLH